MSETEEMFLDGYHSFAVQKMAEGWGCTVEEVLERMVVHWCSEHTEVLLSAEASIMHFQRADHLERSH